MERKRKLKEKEKKEGKQAESLGGVVLSDNDKKLLERWGRMMDNRQSQITESSGAKISQNKAASCEIQPATEKNLQKLNSDKEESVTQTQPNQVQDFKQPQIQPQMGQCVKARVFHPSTASNTVSLGPTQNGDVRIVGGIGVVGSERSVVDEGVVTTPCAFPKNHMLKSHTQFLSVGTMFAGLENWIGTQPNVGTIQHQQQMPHQPLKINNNTHTGFPQQTQTQSQAVTHTQSQSGQHLQLLQMENFITKHLNHSVTAIAGVSDTSKPLPNPDTVNRTQAFDKLCSIGEQQNGSQLQSPPKQPQEVAAQHCLSLTDTGQSTNSIPDIHTVTQQLSKSQVKCFREVKHLKKKVGLKFTLTSIM